MKVHLLGTGTSTGVPIIGCNCEVCTSNHPKNQRYRTSIAIEDDGVFIVIDTGPEFRLQALRAGINKLRYVLFTHIHADHSQGFDDLRAYGFFSKEPIQVYLAAEFFPEFKQRFSYVFNNSGYKGAIPRIVMHAIPAEPFRVGAQTVEPIFLPHGHINTTAFKMGNFLYATDFKRFSVEQIALYRGKIKTMVASGIGFGTHDAHSVVSETIELFQKLEVTRGIITHLSHEVNFPKHQKLLPPGIEYGYDGMVIDL